MGDITTSCESVKTASFSAVHLALNISIQNHMILVAFCGHQSSNFRIDDLVVT